MDKNIIDIVENAKVNHPLWVAKKNDYRYWNDFIDVDKNYKEKLTEEEYKKFLNKSQLEQNISLAQYLQFSSEVTIINYIMKHYNNFKNEPRYNNMKNPECSFEYEGRTVNIEVKCPDLSKRIQQENSIGFKLFAAERFPNKEKYINASKFIKSSINGNTPIKNVDRLDNKLKDYLISAHKKFPNSNSSNFNILVIALEINQDMDEWYSYLFGDNGAFTDRTYITEDYSNVDAVMITNVQIGHKAADIYLNMNCWKLENYLSLLFLDPRKEKIYGLGEYYKNSALYLFGDGTKNFLQFLDDLDSKNDKRKNIINKLNIDNALLSHIFYITDKITDLHIVSNWIETIEKK